jgi:predicted DNA-binding mobile mystery protein A
MRCEDRTTARRQLDKRLNLLPTADSFACPPRGWVKAIREALGMTTAQLGKRLGVSQPRTVAIEKAESTGSITLDSLERAAQALDCRLVYALVPRKPLDELVTERADMLAKKRIKTTRHAMKLKAQDVDARDENKQLRILIEKIIAQGGSKLWEDT